ncbi:unnamed protein product, partial [Rotaria sp. Silwood2]
MKAAGFHYTNIRDTARCDRCQLEVSEWTLDMNPFSIHSDRSPNCPFVHSLKAPNFGSQLLPSSVMAATLQIPAINIDESENSCKRQKLEVSSDKVQIQTLFETELIKKIRRRTFSHWPHKKSPSRAQMIEAGFFHCNVGDRVICLYCNLICQQWTPNADDPWLVHKTLSSKCPYVIDVLVRRGTTSLVILNENPSSNQTSSVAATEGFRSNGIVSTTACHSTYMEIPRRYASFANWSSEQLPNIDDLVRAGFFYTGINTIVTCFYCNGSLQNWGPNDNPMIEHARWFPHCAYAKQLCGDDLYQKIQHSKRLTQEARIDQSSSVSTSTAQGNSAISITSHVEETHSSNACHSKSDSRVSEKPTVTEITTSHVAHKTTSSERMETNATNLTNPCAL